MVAGAIFATLIASPARAQTPASEQAPDAESPGPEDDTESPGLEEDEATREARGELGGDPDLELEAPQGRETLPGLYPQNLGKLKGVGLWAGTPDRAFMLRASGFLHIDSRNAFSAEGSENTLFARRIRLTVDGRLFGDFEYRIMVDQIVDPLVPYDFHVDWRPIHEFNIRVGGFKSPLALERRTRAYAMWFTERSFASSLAPNRMLGLFFYGQTKDGFFSYDVAVGNGPEDLGNLYTLNGTPHLAGRIYFTPFRRIAPHLDKLKHLGIGFSWTLGNERGSPDNPRLHRQRATSRQSAHGGRRLFDYFDDADGTTVARGLRDRQSVHAHWRHGRFNTLFEYVRSARQVIRGVDDVTGDPVHEAYLAHHAWQVMLSVTLHPEDENTWFGVTPKRPLAPSKGQWGGWTVSVRYHELYFDPQSFPRFADPDLWARTLRAVGTSLQWHINLHMELQLDYEITVPRPADDTNQSLPIQHALTFRTELRY
jgi:phosphate-selective porin OprO and OprP